MEIKSYFKLFLGLLFAFFGVVGVFNLWGFFNFNFPWQVWPIGIIVVGVLFMIRQKKIAFFVSGLLIVSAIIFTGVNCCGELESREFVYDFDLDGVDKVDLDLDFGIGEIALEGLDGDDITFEATTRDFNNPSIWTREKVFGDVVKKEIHVSRSARVGNKPEDYWRFFLGDEFVYDLNIDQGVSEARLDISGLKVDNLNIDQGVSESEIIFGDYPVKVFIDGAISEVNFGFLERSGVVIFVEGGMLDKDFDGFRKVGRKYYSEGYDEDGENVEVWFKGVVGDLSSYFYYD